MHRKLRDRITKILERCDFDQVDSELHISYNKPKDDGFSMDVCAIHNKHLIIIECKSSDAMAKEAIDHAIVHQPKILTEIKHVIRSDNNTIKLSHLKKIEHIHYGIAIFKSKNLQATQKKIKSNGMVFWGDEAVSYFEKSSKILSSATKYEILKEFSITPDSKDFHEEDAIKLKQGQNEIFLLGIHPSRLIRMGYVFRRTEERTGSYQRILKANKLEDLKKFYGATKNLLLANSVIIVFDENENIQKKINWNAKEKKLSFPTEYCCAWIIDGQHRIYGFNETTYKKINLEREENFKIPVVAFKKLDLAKQSSTFVDINYNQNRINPVLIHDLASTFRYPKNELTWVSLIVKKLNKRSPWKDMIQVSQNESRKSISIAAFARPVLLNTLLGYNPNTEEYVGPLNKIAPLDRNKLISHKKNRQALKTQLAMLTRFFECVKKNTQGPPGGPNQWSNHKDYVVTKSSGVNALLIALNAIMKKYEQDTHAKLDDYLSVLKDIDFSQKRLKTSRGFSQLEELSEEIIEKINTHTGEEFKSEYSKRY